MAAAIMERRIVLALSIAIALTRFLAVAQSLCDWDEALFALGVRDYEVAEHHPHPPGYPLFIAAAKLVAVTGLDEFRSLQVIVVLGAMFIFPALYWLAREIGFDFTTAVGGAAVYAFLSNVWVYGGTGFSDVPATAIVFVGCALLLRGRTDVRAYIAGAVVLGIAAGFRPANLFVGAVPALMATWMQFRAKSYRAIAAAMFLGLAVVAGSYLGAALASRSIADYIWIVRDQSTYVREIDSWRNPGRGSLYDAAKTFMLRPFGQKDVLNALALAAAMSVIAALVRRRMQPLLTFAIFTPLAVTTWLNLDINTPGRYAIGYLPMHALLAADGFLLFGRKAQIALCSAVVLVFIAWTWPALEMQRETDAPAVAAMKWVRDNAPASTPVYVHAGYGPQASYVLAGRPVHFFENVEEIPPEHGHSWLVDWRLREGGHTFIRPRKTLWKVLRQRSFEASVTPASTLLRFGGGWHELEGTPSRSYRWMNKEGVVLLPSIRGAGIVTLRIYLQVDSLPPPIIVDVLWNGAPIDRITSSVAEVERSWTLQSREGAANELRLVTNKTVVPATRGNSRDTRALGLRLDRLSWTPVH
ncbi:MAG TPA: hypothetical protein VEK79_18235 [Thermoanaerobaculia bacterium]|nr:hypothetical protein [Thermoanaerobaculia bacterium]